jgi:hypothetical protein
VPYRFTGDSERIYPAYRDLSTYLTLQAQPGGIYDMEPCPGRRLHVPPGDGLWAQVVPPWKPSAVTPPPADPKPAPVAPAISAEAQ